MCSLFLPQVIWLDHEGCLLFDGLEWDLQVGIPCIMLGIDNRLKDDAEVCRDLVFFPSWLPNSVPLRLIIHR